MTLGYKIQYPKSWHISEHSNASANIFATFFNSSDNSVLVIILKSPTKQTFEEFTSGLLHNISSATSDRNEAFRDHLELMSTAKTARTTISGIDAWKITTYSVIPLLVKCGLSKTTMHTVFNFGSDDVNGMIYEPVFQKMVNSFQIIK